VDYNLTLLERLGIPVTDRRHRVGVTGAQREKATRLLEEAGVNPDGPVLGVQAGGAPAHPERQWPSSHYASVLQRAAGELGYQPVLLGGASDRRTLDAVVALGKRDLPRLLDLPFDTYKAVLSRLDFFITHDGEPVHVAAGVGVPSYFVFLSTPPWRSAPYGAHVSVWEEFGRSPSPAEVWERARPLMEAARDRRGAAAETAP
jgi:ADP-heptose:LPS heptosyltransferase